MSSHDMRGGAFDILAGLGLLTRLPVRVDGPRAAARGGAAAWAWPLAGAVVGAFGACAGSVALGLGLGTGAAAALVLACQMLVTGALHEDGLADSADGLWGGWDKARRLAIMKDSHIGTYGALALMIVTLLRWSALVAILDAGSPWSALIAAGAISRAPMAALMAALPNARGTGLSHSVGRPDAVTAANGVILAFGIGVFCVEAQALALVLVTGLVGLGTGVLARSRIGGQTGDILGATQQLAEVAILTLIATRLPN